MAKKLNTKNKSNIPQKIDISIDEFGELQHNMDIDLINKFLNENMEDWRLSEMKKAKNNEEE